MAKVGSVLKTTIDVDSMQANNSLRGLKSIVDAVTNAWKSQEIQLKSTGNYLEASERRYNGLGEAMRRQKELIEQQVAGQKRLEENTKNMTNATVKETEQWGRYQKDIERAELKLASMTTQQERAKNAMDKEVSGINALTVNMEKQGRATDSYVKLLKSQGDEESAISAKRKAANIQLEQQEKLYEKNNTLLKQVGEQSGFTSDAYKKQKIALENVATEMNNTKKKLKDLDDEEVKAVVKTENHRLGVDKLRKSMELQDSVSKAYIGALESEGSHLKTLAGKQSELVSSRNRSKTALNAEAELLKNIGNRLGTTSDEYQKQKIKVLEAESSYNKFNNELKETRVELARVSPLGVNKLTVATDNLKKSASGIKSAFSGAFSGVDVLARGAVTAMAGVTVGVGASIKMAAGLQDQYTRTSNLIVTGDTREISAKDKLKIARKQSNQMLEDGRKYSVDYGVSQTKIADGYQELVKRGYEGTQALGSMKSMMEASVASGDDFNTVVHSATSAIESYGYKTESVTGMAKNTNEVVNKMAFVADKTATDFKGMGVALEYAGSTAHAIGIPLSQTSAMIGILSNNGLEAQKSGTGLRKVLNSLTSGLADTGDSTDKTAEKTAKYNEQIASTKERITEMEAQQKGMTDKGSSQYTKLTNKIAAAKDKLGTLGDKLEDVGNTKTKQSALEGIGLDANTLKNSNGEMKSVSEIMTILGQKTQNMGKGEKAALFTKIFGTTGQQAALILSENASQIDALAAAADKAAQENYVSDLAQKNMKTANASLKRLKMAAEAVASIIGAKFLPALEGVSSKIVEAFDSKAGKQALEELGDSVSDVADKFSDWVSHLKKDDLSNMFKGFVKGAGAAIKITADVLKATGDFVSFCANHQKAIKVFAEVVGSIFVLGRVTKFIGGVKEFFALFGAQNKSITVVTDAIAAQNKILSENIGLKETSGKVNMGGAGSVATGGAGVVGEAGVVAKGASSGILKSSLKGSIPMALISSLLELQGTNSKNVGQKVGGASGSFAGTVGGAAAGAALGSVVPIIGTGVGGIIGGMVGGLGGTEVGKKLGEEIQKGLKKTKLTTPKVKPLSNKDAYKQLNKEAKSYYSEKQKQETADLEKLKKNGKISNKEYEKRLNNIKANGLQGSKFENMNQKDRNTMAKYYAQQRSGLEEKYNKKISSTQKSWSKKITDDTLKYGASSYKVKEDIEKRDAALAKLGAKKKSAVEKQKLKYTQSATLSEAKLHTTLNGKIQLASSAQLKILDKLTSQKGKLSNKQLQTAVNNAEKEVDSVFKLTEKQYKNTKKSWEKQVKSVTTNAEKQRKETVAKANSQYQDAVEAANKQYSGTDAASTAQRKKLIAEAETQKKDTVKKAQEQKDKVVGHAETQKAQALEKAGQQRDNAQRISRDQRDKVKEEAKEQSRGVVTHAVNQANSSNAAQKKQAEGTHGIWGGIIDFFNGIGKFFHMDKVRKPAGGYGYAQATMGAYATGGIANSGKALVGEAGPEAKYSPYSGKVDFVGINGAEIVNLQQGEHILNAADTAKLFNGGLGHTMAGYAKGTDGISGFLSKMANGASDIWDNISDAAESVMDKLTNPVKTLKNLASSIFSNNLPNVGSFPKNLSGGMTNKVIDSVGDTLSKIKKAFDDNGSSSAPAGSGVQRWKKQVVKALKANGLSTSSAMVNKVLRQINTESGGNEKAMGGTDGLADGRAMGLMQVKPGTFNANKFPGHNNIMNGYDSLLAGLNYAKKRYGKDLSFLGKGHGYANGGIISKHGMYEIGEGNKAEAVIPLDAMKRTRGWELLFNVMSHFAGDDLGKLGMTGSRTAGNSEVSELRQQVSDLTTQISDLITALGSHVTEVKIEATADKRAIFQGSARYMNEELNSNRTIKNRLAGRRF